MADSDEKAQYTEEFTARVAAARASLGWKQWQMAEALNMAQDKYKQYEGRSLLPHHLIERFCLITHIDPKWLVTGRGEKPIKAIGLVETTQDKPTPKRKRARAKRAA